MHSSTRADWHAPSRLHSLKYKITFVSIHYHNTIIFITILKHYFFPNLPIPHLLIALFLSQHITSSQCNRLCQSKRHRTPTQRRPNSQWIASQLLLRRRCCSACGDGESDWNGSRALVIGCGDGDTRDGLEVAGECPGEFGTATAN